MRNLAAVAAVMLGVCLGGLAVDPPRAWADDAFARITVGGVLIEGDQPAINSIPGSANTVQVFSTTFGFSNPPSPTNPLIIPGTAKPKPVGLVKRVDRASPRLLRAAILGQLLTVEIVWFMNINGVAKQTSTLRLEDAFISNIESSAQLNGNNAGAFEELSIIYSRIRFTVPSGTTTLSVCYDFALNRPC